MWTHSIIAVLQKEDGSVKSIFCHRQSRVSEVGKVLLTYYNTYEKANALIALGNVEWLRQRLNPLPEAPEAHMLEPEIITTHSFERPQVGVTVAYHRDGGKKFVQKVDPSIDSFYQSRYLQDYSYLFMDGKWYVTSITIKPHEYEVSRRKSAA